MLIHTVTKSCSIASFISRTAHLFSFPVIKIFRGIYKLHIMDNQDISVKIKHATSKGSCSLLQWNVLICFTQEFFWRISTHLDRYYYSNIWYLLQSNASFFSQDPSKSFFSKWNMLMNLIDKEIYKIIW